MLSRRELLLLVGGAAAGGAGARFLGGGRSGDTSGVTPPVADDAAAFHGPYGHAVEPPRALGPQALDAATVPPARVDGATERTITVVQRPIEIAAGQTLDAWTFDGTIPGPVLCVTAGNRLSLTVRNRTAHPHNLHTHGAHDPSVDGWEPIPAGGEYTYSIDPSPAGLYPYHCDVMPSAQHIGRGLYGALIVDPPVPRPAAIERVLILGGFDLNGDGRSELFGWNGVAGYFARHPIKVPVGALVRLHVINLVPDEPVATFHLHAQTFDVFRSGTRSVPDEHTDVVSLTLGERAMLEMRFPVAGRYMFHPHQARMAERGAMGWIAAVDP